tara:strand:+ start:389 stop:544 length:156 start_codon:yes stop_codon:yes gene_type:complete
LAFFNAIRTGTDFSLSFFFVHNEAHNTKRDSTYRLTARIESISIDIEHVAE